MKEQSVQHQAWQARLKRIRELSDKIQDQKKEIVESNRTIDPNLSIAIRALQKAVHHLDWFCNTETRLLKKMEEE